MKIPKDDKKRLDLYTETVQICLASRQSRMQQYAVMRQMYLNGALDGISPWNKIYSHLDTVSSFLYASDSTRFTVALGTLAPKSEFLRVDAFGRRINEEWKSANYDIIFQQAILWALVYNTMLVKHIRRQGGLHPFAVDPSSFGVYREDIPMLDRQEAFSHVFYMTQSDLERRLLHHPKRDEILKQVVSSDKKEDVSSQPPAIVDQVVLNSMGPMTNMTGQANINMDVLPITEAQVETPLIEMQETWIWNDDDDDYQVVTMASGVVPVYDRTNIFMPRSREWEAEQPFVQVCPNPLYDYFWGVSECARLAPLQEKRNARMDDIQTLLAKQVNPPTAFFGMGLTEDKVTAFDQPGSYIAGSDPSATLKSYQPQIPADVYADVRQIDEEFDETSGLTNVTKGGGEAGVRSAGHAGKLLTIGSARPKKRALIIEDALEKSATLLGKSIFNDDPAELEDDHGEPFIVAQMSPHFTIQVDAHSNSPVFMDNERDNAVILMKAHAIDREDFIEMIAPSKRDKLVRNLREKIIPQEKAAAAAKAAQEAASAAAKNGGKPDLKGVG